MEARISEGAMRTVSVFYKTHHWTIDFEQRQIDLCCEAPASSDGAISIIHRYGATHLSKETRSLWKSMRVSRGLITHPVHFLTGYISQQIVHQMGDAISQLLKEVENKLSQGDCMVEEIKKDIIALDFPHDA